MFDVNLINQFSGIAGSGFTTGTRPVTSPNGEIHVAVRTDALTVFDRDAETNNLSLIEVNQSVGNDGFGNLINIDSFSTVIFSPDSEFVYATGSQPDGTQAFARFSVNEDGRLEFLDNTTLPTAGLFPEPVISPDGEQLYVPVSDVRTNRIAIFDRDPDSGELNFFQTQDFTEVGFGFGRVARLTFNEDGSRLAATSGSNGVQILQRDQETGSLTELETIRGGDVDINGDTVSALNTARVAAFGPGNIIYVTSQSDNAISVFELSESGFEILEENRNTFDDGFGNQIEGLSIFSGNISVIGEQELLATGGGSLFEIENNGRGLRFIDSFDLGTSIIGRVPDEPIFITSRGTVFEVTGLETSNQAPMANADSAQTTADEAVTIDVLANDSDPDGDTLTIQGVGAAANGQVEITNDGRIVFTPDAGFTGTDSFTYTVSDGNGGTDTADVNVTVERAQDGSDPIGENDDFVILQRTSPSVLSAGQGDDTYILSENTLNGDENLTLQDGQGTNRIQLAPGLEIAKSIVAADALQLELTNGSVINVNGADEFRYEAGANVIVGGTSANVSFSTFVSETLGLQVPTSGVVEGGGLTINLEQDVSDSDDGVFADTAGADDLTGTDGADTLTLLPDGQDDNFDATDSSFRINRDTLDLSGLDPAQLGDRTPIVDLREGFVETAISGRDTIANFDTVIGTDTGDELLGRDDGGGWLVDSFEPVTATMTRILDGVQFIDGGGADTVDLRGGGGFLTLSADGVAEADLRADDQGFSSHGLDLSLATDGVTVNLAAQNTAANVVSGGEVGDQPGTTVSGFNSVEGSDFDDVLSAPGLVFDGAGADDITLTENNSPFAGVLYLSADGTQEQNLQGNGGGRLNLIAATGGVTVDLSAQGSNATAISGGGLGDQSGTTISGFTDVRAARSADDTLFGDDGANWLNGGGGDDNINGRAGDDVLQGSSGADVLTGGEGADQFSTNSFGQDVDQITDFDAAEGDTLRFFVGNEENLDPVFQQDVVLQDPTVTVDGFFSEVGEPDQTPNIVVQDDGDSLTRVFFDDNGDGNYDPDRDGAVELVGTIQSTGIDAEALVM